jgi:hypothetical protein
VSATVSVLEDAWCRLEAAGPPSAQNGVQTAGVGVTAAGAEVVVAIDVSGFRHVLVPLRGDQRVRRSDGDGSALCIRERPLDDGVVRRRYLDLGCLKTDLNGAFTSVCADVVDAVRNTPDTQIKASLAVVERWRELFKVSRPRLDAAQLAGLFGEVWLLIKLLGADPSATAHWSGPTGHRHDFTAQGRAIEVKVSTTGDANTVRIHGLDQLDPPPGGALDLMWLHVDRSDNAGDCLPEVVARAMHLADDEALLTAKLETAGYHSAESDSYAGTRFTVLDERWYEVTRCFPRLTVSMLEQAGLDVLVSEVQYDVDLAGAVDCRLDASVVDERVSEFLKGAP